MTRMTLKFDAKRLLARMEREGIEEPTGLLAVSPEIMSLAEQKAGRAWDGTQEDAEVLVGAVMRDVAL